MTIHENGKRLVKRITGIPGFDVVAEGGLPVQRTTLVTGTAGSAKTVFAVQFLVAGMEIADEKGVFVAFEESPADIRKNVYGFGWDLERYEEEGRLVFVDASPQVGDEDQVAGEFDFGALAARVESAVRRVGASRVSLDSIHAVLNRFGDAPQVRHELYTLSSLLRKMDVTVVMTAERTEEYGSIARFGVEEFVADNVIILRNALESEKRRRTMEVLKFRGTSHQKGEFPFTITSGQGIVVIPLSAMELKQKSSTVRIASGNDELDRMCGGGFFRDSIVLLSGATGTGKTLMTTEFIAGGAYNDEKCLLLASEESREQLFRNAIGWGVDYEQMEKDGLIRVWCRYPEAASTEDHLISMKEAIDEFKPNRVAIDSLSAFERVSTLKGFREFVIGLTSYIKQAQIAGLFTANTPTLTGGSSITETHISTITDSIILLRYVELYGEMRRGITVLKMRGSLHDKDIREFTIDGSGMHIGKQFRNVSGILAGSPQQLEIKEVERLNDLFANS
jgi:circadian clock protein KaiC